MAASDSWSASELLEIASYLPVVLSAFTIIYDSLHIFRYPLSVSSAYRVFTSPFQNFLHLDDLAEAVDIKPKVVVPRWKPKFLLSISLLETLTQFTRLVITCLGNDFDKLGLDLCLCLAWVIVLSVLPSRSLLTFLYLVLFFAENMEKNLDYSPLFIIFFLYLLCWSISRQTNHPYHTRETKLLATKSMANRLDTPSFDDGCYWNSSSQGYITRPFHRY